MMILNMVYDNKRSNHRLKTLNAPPLTCIVNLLTDLFPEKKSEIRKYIKMAGYSDQEIRKFIDRTLKKD